MSAQLDAFAGPAAPVVAGVPTTQQKPTRAPWWYEVAAREQLGMGDDWELCSLESIGERGDVLVQGSVTTKNKAGRRVWAKPLQMCVTTAADIARVTAEYEARTGNCGGCGGDGLQMGRASYRGVAVTYEYRTCSRCGGAGVPRQEVA